MRFRLQATYVSLLLIVLVSLDVPLAYALTTRAAQLMFIDRAGDTARFASLAEPALRTGRVAALTAELRLYDEMFGIAAAVLGRDGQPVVASRDGLRLDEAARAHVDDALSNRHAALDRVYWPWQAAPLVVAQPVGNGGEVIGVVLTVSPTGELRLDVGRRLAVLIGASLLVLLLGAASAGPLSRWMLRPVERLDDAVDALAQGRFADRARLGPGPPELRRLTVAFNRMAERTATLMERQRNFASYASHQLRTPLATMRLCVENLDTAVRPDGIEDHRTIAEEIERLGLLCDSLLAYARAEVTASESAEVDAAAVVAQRIGAWRAVAAVAGVELRRAGLDQASARVALRALDQALDALLSNAIKFAGRGAEVVVTVARTDWVDIHVVDNGPGLSPEDLARAVEPFWRRPGAQNIDGSGLGVTIAEALVTASGGRFTLGSAHPHGVHATIRLPPSGTAP